METKPHILVVDDEPGIRDTLYYNLTDRGYEVETAENGKMALAKLKSAKFNAVLSDIVMEDVDGIKLLKKLKETAKNLPVILFTGYASAETSIPAVNLGAYAYLKKPIFIEKLVKILDRAIKTYKVTESKDKVFEKYVKVLLNRKKQKELRLKKDGVIENNIEIPADPKNFNLIKKHITTRNKNKNAKILIVTKNKIMGTNIARLLKFSKYKNYKYSSKFSIKDSLNYSVIIVDLKHYKSIFFKVYNALLIRKPEIKVIPIINNNEKELREKLHNSSIESILERPVKFDDLLRDIEWQAYLSRNDKIEKKVKQLPLLKRLKGDLLYLVLKKINWIRVAVITMFAVLIGLSISYIFIRDSFNQLAPSKKHEILKLPSETDSNKISPEQLYEYYRTYQSQQKMIREREIRAFRQEYVPGYSRSYFSGYSSYNLKPAGTNLEKAIKKKESLKKKKINNSITIKTTHLPKKLTVKIHKKIHVKKEAAPKLNKKIIKMSSDILIPQRKFRRPLILYSSNTTPKHSKPFIKHTVPSEHIRIQVNEKEMKALINQRPQIREYLVLKK